ncbi:MAG: hypothetical protein LBC74_07410, partial [Planctomycetaceae bacterium]|nr:hypothetical protein [Planctomycetaceae bacterium]
VSKLIDKESPFRCSNELAANKLATIKTTKRLFQGQLNSYQFSNLSFWFCQISISKERIDRNLDC